MGGYGALRFAFRHPQLFGSVSAHSAALIEKLPRTELDSSSEDIVQRALGKAFGTPFDRAFWDRNNPFTIVRAAPPPAGMQIYFDCGTEDEFGFYRGAQAFHDLLVSRKIPHEFHLYPGGHDWGYFAEHLPSIDRIPLPRLRPCFRCEVTPPRHPPSRRNASAVRSYRGVPHFFRLSLLASVWGRARIPDDLSLGYEVNEVQNRARHALRLKIRELLPDSANFFSNGAGSQSIPCWR